MKKLILILGIVFSVNGYSQHKVYPTNCVKNDTTFYSKKGIWYEKIIIDKPIDDSISWLKFDNNIVSIKKEEKKRRRNTRIFDSIGLGVFILGNIIVGIVMSK